VLADLANDVATEVERRVQVAVFVTEKTHAFDAEHVGRRPLFAFSRRGENFVREFRIFAALRAVGADHVIGLSTLAHEAGYGRAAAEFGVVGMRAYDEDTLELSLRSFGRRSNARLGYRLLLTHSGPA
jgi:hypothetical protein